MVKQIKYFVQQSWLLITASFVFGLLIAMTYSAWKPRIDANKTGKFEKQVAEIVGEASVEKLDGKFVIDEKTTTEVYKIIKDGQTAGYAFSAKGPAYDVIELVIVVDADCEKYLGYGVLVCNETPGFGDKIKFDYYRNQFVGVETEQLKLVKNGDADNKDTEIVAISGATISSQGVVDIFNRYIDKIKEQLKDKK